VAVICVVQPLAWEPLPKLARGTLAIAYWFIAFHPISEAAHYRLFSPTGRAFYTNRNKAFPRITGQEVVSVAASLIGAIVIGLAK